MWVWGLGLLAAAWIAWEDFRNREINILAFAAFALLGVLSVPSLLSPVFYLPRLLSLSIIVFMLGVIWLVFRRKGAAVMDNQLGWGDVVMLLCLAIWLDTQTFLYLFTLTTSVLVIGYLILQRMGKLSTDHPIPLAGWLAISFMIYSFGERLAS
ncbi:MAG: hypothetical protein AAFQ87_27600 [Bacteroidota bacterium]